MAESASGQDEASPDVLICYPKGQGGRILTARNFPLWPRKKKVHLAM